MESMGKASKPVKKSSIKVPPDMSTNENAERLNMVVCGSDAAVKASISDLLVGQREQRAESSSVCVKREAEVSGHLLTLVEMPALYNTNLSEQQVMQQTLHCVSLCPPGVHAFLFVVAEGHLTDEDKAEMEIIQRIFSSRVLQHTILLINQKSQHEEFGDVINTVISGCACRYMLFSDKTDWPELISCVNKLVAERKVTPYSESMYHSVQMETQLQYKREIQKLKETIDDLILRRSPTQGSRVPDGIRIVLLGKTGVGKSATGNTILGTEDVFKEDISDESVTRVCQKETYEIRGRLITVIDTPGVFDTNVPNMETTKEITKCISMAAPGPHVFLLVLKVGQRFTQEERDTVNLIKETFGEKSKLYTIVLFTRGDELKGHMIDKYIEKASADLKKLLYEFGNRYHVFNNNKIKSSYAQVSALLDKIDSMIKVNGGSCYTNEMFQQVETEIQKKQERILMEKQEEIEREKEELKAKYEAQMEDIRKEMLEQKEKQEEEQKRKQQEFKEREQEIKLQILKREQIQREEHRKMREGSELKMKEWMAQIQREIEQNREQLETQKKEEQKRRAREEEERRKREEEWMERERKEKDKFEKEKQEIKKCKKAEFKGLEMEYEKKVAEEEKKRRDLEEKIKQAEDSKKKELQNLQLAQQQEWERWRSEEVKRRHKQRRHWEKKITTVEEEWYLEQVKRQTQYERDRQKEMMERDLRKEERREEMERERKRIESEMKEKIEAAKKQHDVQRQKEENERKEKDEKQRKEMEEKLQVLQETFRREREEAEKIRSEAEQRNIAYIRETHSKELERLQKQVELRTRKEAENEFYSKFEEKVKEAKEKGFEEGCAKVESERSTLGRRVDKFVNWICVSNQDTFVRNRKIIMQK